MIGEDAINTLNELSSIETGDRVPLKTQEVIEQYIQHNTRVASMRARKHRPQSQIVTMAISKHIHTAMPANPIGNSGVQRVSVQSTLDQIARQITYQAVGIGFGEQRMSQIIQRSGPRRDSAGSRATPTPVLQHRDSAPSVQRHAHKGRKTHNETR